MASGRDKIVITLPAGYRPGFAEELDRRTVMGRAVHDRIEAIEQDLGGGDTLSHTQRSLVRRAVWLEMVIEAHECSIAGNLSIEVGGYSQVLNSYLGVCRLLGIARRQKPARRLREALEVPS